MKYSEIVKKTALILKGAGIENSIREAKVLLMHIAGITKEELFLNPDAQLPYHLTDSLLDLISRRANGEPLSKVIGVREFWSLPFKVTKDTLDPRPDSETVIKAVLDQFPDRNQALDILDLGTGTGCLMISLLTEYPNAKGIAVDLSFEATKIAQENATALKVSDRLLIVNSSWINAIRGQFNIIVSNPPYIGRKEVVDAAVVQYDPDLALFAENEGYEHYAYFSRVLAPYLHSDGKLFLEFGYKQEKKVINLFKNNHFEYIKGYMDLNLIHRCACFARVARQ